ncbi:hypothetical protein RUND412_009128 [Rhizina undulata]
MDSVIDDLVRFTNQKLLSLSPDARYIISVSGIPGSGKTTLAGKVAKGLNTISQLDRGLEIAAVVPMDGYHLTRAALDAMSDPVEAHARRGAPFTFDPISLKKLIIKLKEPISSSSAPAIYAPSFDHAKKDPIENDIPILCTQRILIFEGLYLSLATDVWGDISRLFDELWFVEVERSIARNRLIARHVASGIVDSAEAAARRADENDLPNGDYILANKAIPHRVINSVVDEEYAKDK